MGNMTKISIITICYNAAQELPPTLQSVAAQDYPNIEYIIVDGGSQDDSLEIIARLCPQALVKSEPDRGLYDAMNKGLQRATGSYVWFLNAGDALHTPHTVAHVVATLEKENFPEVLYGDTLIVNEARQSLGLRRLRPPKQLTPRHYLKGMLVCHQAFVVARAIAQPYNLHWKLSSDFDWCFRMVKAANHTAGDTTVWVEYLAGGLSQQRHWQSLKERFAIMQQHFGLLPTVWAHITFLFRRNR